MAGTVGDARDPLERLERPVAGEVGLRHRREPLVWHRHAGFEERRQGVQYFEVGSECAFDCEGRSRDPEVEVRLYPIPLDLCRESVRAETDHGPSEDREDKQAAREARESDRHLRQKDAT